MRYKYLLLLFYITFLQSIFAKQSTARFIANKGQWQSDILFKQDFHGGHILFGTDKVTYILYDLPKETEEEGHHHHLPSNQGPLNGNVHTMQFVGANPSAEVKGEAVYGDYCNYYLGNDPSRWAHHVPVFQQVKYHQIYAGIDAVFEVIDDQLKYTFYVAPFANVNDIQLAFEGMEKLGLDAKGNVVLSTPITAVIEQKPVAFQEKEIPCNYQIHDKTVQYTFPQDYNHAAELVIDPIVIFSTFTGSSQDNWGFTATYDALGNAYGGGIIWNMSGYAVGSTGYPTVPGAFQTSFSGGDRDAAITKYNPLGTALIFSTYFGGSYEENPQSMVTNSMGELLVYGRTNSSNFPFVTGSYDVTFNGTTGGGNANYDIYVAKFSPTGALQACTFLGGTGNDGMNGTLTNLPETYLNDFLNYNYSDDARGEIVVDDQDNVYIASCSASSDFPVTTGCYQSTMAGGRDAVVAKFNPSLSTLSFSTYLGGTNIDAAYGIKADNTGIVYVTGGTRSTNFPTTAGSVQTAAPGGNTDGFLVKLNSTGSSLLASTYVGTSNTDQSYFVELDDYNNPSSVFITGQSLGTIPVVNAAYSVANSRQFIREYDINLANVLMSTNFGSSGSTKANISPTAFLVDNCGQICVAGWGGNIQQFSPGNTLPSGSGGGTTFNMPITANAYQSSTDGSDFYIIVLGANANSLVYGTYFGGNGGGDEHVDGGTSRFDPRGVIYEAACAGCGSSNLFPTTPGVWSQNNGSPNCNLGLFKIDLQLGGIAANFNPTDSLGAVINVTTTGCAPLTIDFDNLTVGQNPLTTTYFWDFGYGGGTSTLFEPSFTYPVAGTYTVMLVVTDTTACEPHDTTYKTIIVYPPPAVNAGPDQTLCPGVVAQLNAVGVGTFSWTPSSFLSNNNIANPTANPSSTTQYTVTLTDANGCKASDNVVISIQNSMTVSAGNDILLCTPATVSLNASASQTATYSWSPSTGLSNPNIANPTCTIASGQQTYVVTATTAAGCTGSDSITVGIFEVNIAQSSPKLCIGDSVTLSTGITSNVTFSWSPATYLNSTSIATPTSTPTQTTSYTVYVTNPVGCSDTGQITVQVIPLPVVNAGSDVLECRNTTVGLQASSNPANVSWSWSPSTGLSNTNIANPVGSYQGQQIYTVTATNTDGCVGTDAITVGIFPLNFVPSTPETCYGKSIMLSTGIVGASTYSWTPAIYLDDASLATPTATPFLTTLYTVYISASSGCKDTGSVNLQVWQLPIADAGSDIDVCVNNSTQLNASGGQTYLWQPATGLSNNTLANPMVNILDTISYSLLVTDIHGCQDYDSVTVNVVQNPVITTNGPFIICQGDSIQLVATGGQSYSWYESNYLTSVSIPNPIAFPMQPTTFIVKGFGINNCYDTASVFVNAIPKPKTDVTGDFSVCLGDRVSLHVTGGDSYLWENGGTDDYYNFTPTQSQWISCQATLGNCPGIPDSIYVNVITSLPIADFEMLPDSGWAPMPVYFMNRSIGEVRRFYWDFGYLPSITTSTEENPRYIYPHAGTYPVTLIVWDVNGCRDTVQKNVFAENVTLFVPSVFTPNGDNSNDFFQVGYYGIKTLHIDIYDRWGELIYSSDDRNFRWDGTYKNIPCPENAFVYVIRGRGENNKEYFEKGTVTLIR